MLVYAADSTNAVPMTHHTPPTPVLEDPERLSALRRTGLVAAERVASFDRLVHAAALAVRAPVAQINLVTGDRQIPRATTGPGEWMSNRPVSLDFSYCQHVVASPAPLAITDSRIHPLTRESRATRESGIVSYAAAPLTTADGHTLGTLCAIDFRVREWTPEEMEILRALATVAVVEIEERLRGEREASRSLRESEERYRTLTEVDPDGIVVMDDTGVIVSANPAMERIFGYPPEELIGKPLSMLIPERLRAAHEQGMRRYLATGRRNIPWTGVELPGLTRAGREIATEISFGEYVQDGRHAFAGFIHDISRRKREEMRRAAEHAVTRALAESASLDEAARRIMPAVGEPLGWDIGALWGVGPAGDVLTCMELWLRPGVHADRFVEATRAAAFARGEGLPGRAWAAGTAVWIVDAARDPALPRAGMAADAGLHGAAAFPITVGGAVRGVIEFFTREVEQPDDSLLRTMDAIGSEIGQFVERLRAEAGRDQALTEALEARLEAETQADELQAQASQLEETQAELEMANDDLQRANADLEFRTEEAEGARAAAERANQAKSQFLSTMSHEVRTPINAVIGYAELLQMEIAGPLTEMQRDYLVRVRGASQHLLALIGDVLDLSRVEAGEMQVGDNAVRLRETVNGALDLVRPQATEAGVEIEFDPGPDAVYRSDPGRVGQILVNLLSNAVKFTESGGRVRVICTVTDDAEVRSARAGPWIRTDVEDTGIGVAPEHAEEIFEPFYQVEGGYTRESGGTGLGLAISRRLARLMGGDITLQSRPGEGSRFTLWLPAVLEAGAAGRNDAPA